MEIHAVQVLGPGDTSLQGAGSGAVLIDSETGATQGVQITRATEQQYSTLLAQHNAEVRQQCLGAQISFTGASIQAVEASVEERALETVGRMGLFV